MPFFISSAKCRNYVDYAFPVDSSLESALKKAASIPDLQPGS
jgi:hypothetical protein